MRKTPRPKPVKVVGAGYSGKPLIEKLGMKPDARAAVIEAPQDYVALLGYDGFDTELEQDHYDFLHFFTASALALEHVLPILAGRLERDGMIWISWPKKTSGTTTDLNENIVRETGLRIGLVDVKVCAIDATWSGLKFVVRLKDR